MRPAGPGVPTVHAAHGREQTGRRRLRNPAPPRRRNRCRRSVRLTIGARRLRPTARAVPPATRQRPGRCPAPSSSPIAGCAANTVEETASLSPAAGRTGPVVAEDSWRAGETTGQSPRRRAAGWRWTGRRTAYCRRKRAKAGLRGEQRREGQRGHVLPQRRGRFARRQQLGEERDTPARLLDVELAFATAEPTREELGQPGGRWRRRMQSLLSSFHPHDLGG